MRIVNNILKSGSLALALMIIASACDKVDYPALGDYPKDSNPAGGPVSFYTAFDGLNADSIRATYATTDSSTSYIDGINGKAIQFNPVIKKAGGDSSYSYLVYPSANDFATTATNFTVSFWMKISLAQKDSVNADAILALSSTVNFWGNITIFADHFATITDSMQLKFHFMNGSADNWDFQYAGANMLPMMYDDQWHQIVFTYDATIQTGSLYRDGVLFNAKANEVIKFDGNASNLVVAGFQQAANIDGTYADNSWMSGFPGAIDQLKFYTEALTADNIATNFANKQ